MVTGDHGESFLEHGPRDWLHGHSVGKGAVRVPLIVRYPGAGGGAAQRHLAAPRPEPGAG